jgi:desulfoferrodoxin (superoxide reductase-like protein)
VSGQPIWGGLVQVRKIKFALCLSVLFVAVFAAAAAAHPPKGVTVSMSPDGILTVKVEHSVNDPQKHYISKIIVYVDGKIAAQRDYSAQTSADGHTDTFQLGAQTAGANIKAEAYCVIMGSAAGSLKL